MTRFSNTFRLFGRRTLDGGARQEPAAETPPVDIAPNDPLLAYFESTSGPVDVDKLDLDSPALELLRAGGVKLAVPLVSQGELIGVLNLGPRRSQGEYTVDDRRLLDNLAGNAAAAVRVAQLVRQQQDAVRARERLENELRVATMIQQQFLPKELPNLPGWEVAAFYRPAREVGGDFYDFIPLPNGRIGLVVGDVTDKGVPAALVMATTHSILRTDAPRLVSPGAVLARANELLVPDIPASMFVTCLYAVLDPATGHLTYANAGHNLPYVRGGGDVVELRATGMPLGLMAGMEYEERHAILLPGQGVLLHSDGLVEAHGPDREMFGFPRLRGLVSGCRGRDDLIALLLRELDSFTGDGWEQEDDITLVSVQRDEHAGAQTVAEFTLPSSLGNERTAMDLVAAAVARLGLPPARLERLKTAVAETTGNAIEHGNGCQPDVPVAIRVLSDGSTIWVRITDHGTLHEAQPREEPDLEAKLEGRQTPRGWGLFLVEHMVDDAREITEPDGHTVELTMHLEEPRRDH